MNTRKIYAETTTTTTNQEDKTMKSNENKIQRLEDVITELVGYIAEVQNDDEDTYNTLKLIVGMTDEEIKYFAPVIFEEDNDANDVPWEKY